MLKFNSSSARIVNTKRAVNECMEIALGDQMNTADLLIFHASIGHDFKDMVSEAKRLAPQARIVAASCCGVVGREGVSESMKDMALMTIHGKEFSVGSVDGIFGHNSYEKTLEMAQKMKAENANINMIYFLASGIDIANDQCIEALEEVFGKEVDRKSVV